MKVVIAGDFCPIGKVATLFKNGQYNEVLGEVRYRISDISPNLSIVNLEAPIECKGMQPLSKCGPRLLAPSQCIDAAHYAGFNMFTLANNHILDYGENCISEIIEKCKKYGILTVGAGMNLKKAEETMFYSCNSERIAIINCCEHEFSIATHNTAGANPINPIKQFYAIKKAKYDGADYILLIVHGGSEGYHLPSPRMQELYRFFIDSGANVVVNHHQHCYSGYEEYNGGTIFYGLGNFCFEKLNNRINDNWFQGILLLLDFTPNGISYKLMPYTQCRKNSLVEFLVKDDLKKVFLQIEYLNSIINSPRKLNNEYQCFLKQVNRMYELSFTPYDNKIFQALYYKGFLPHTHSKDKLIRLYNYVMCESHLDNLRQIIRNMIEENE